MNITIRPVSVGALARGRDYKVNDLGDSPQGYTNLLKRELGVSRDAGAPQTRYTQLHECSHVEHDPWTPDHIAAVIKDRLGKVIPVECILAAADARINELLLRKVSDCHRGFELAYPLREDLGGYVASHAAPPQCKAKIRKAIQHDKLSEMAAMDAKIKELITDRPNSELTVWRVTVPLAIALAEAQGKAESTGEGEGSPEAGESRPSKGEPDTGADSATGPSTTMSDEEALGDPSEGSPEEEPCPGPYGDPPSPRSCDEWEMPVVLEPALTVRQQKGNYATLSADTGNKLRWPHLYRIQTDGRVFARARRKPGALQRGTVLIDVSGSMGFADEDLSAMLDLLPHATIAMYYGLDDRFESGKPGRAAIVILARNGARVAHIPRHGGGNTCDGPALLWLSRQAGPRLWVCDGVTTNKADSPWGDEECAAIVQTGSIVQVSPGYKGKASRKYHTAYGRFDLERFKVQLKNVEKGKVD